MTAAIVDATEALAVVVRERHRRGAVQCSASRCPAANALHALPGVLDAKVSYTVALVMWEPGTWTRYGTERNTELLIRRFDREGDAMPAGYRLEFVPHPSPTGSRAGERPGSDQRSGAGTSIATRSPSPRSLWREP